MKQFFGPKKDERELIEVEKTTAEAFQTMIDFIYSQGSSTAGKEAFTLNFINCPQKLHELLELTDRYQVVGLTKLAKERLQKMRDEGFEVTCSGPAGEDWGYALGRFEPIIGEEREGFPVYKQDHTKEMPDRDGDILLRRSCYSKEWFIEEIPGGIYPLLKASIGVGPSKPPTTGWQFYNCEKQAYQAAKTVTCKVISRT